MMKRNLLEWLIVVDHLDGRINLFMLLPVVYLINIFQLYRPESFLLMFSLLEKNEADLECIYGNPGEAK